MRRDLKIYKNFEKQKPNMTEKAFESSLLCNIVLLEYSYVIAPATPSPLGQDVKY